MCTERQARRWRTRSSQTTDLAVLVNPAENWDKGLSRTVIKMYPEVRELYQPGELQKEGFRYLTNVISVKLSSGNNSEKLKRVYVISFEPHTDEEK